MLLQLIILSGLGLAAILIFASPFIPPRHHGKWATYVGTLSSEIHGIDYFRCKVCGKKIER